ncbi:MAG: ABC transporter ATP-binding protein [Planctomycetes bacterium]|jgi:lipoprotein-releasing system ATP-binding protein|nr:ABC transporter ATP-binding protein [Planctomycetota bacterium]
MSDLAIEACNLHKSYRMGKVNLHVLRGVSLGVREGEFVGIVGASGSGKSTLLHLLGLLDRPDEGRLVLHGCDMSRQSHQRRNNIRCHDIGFVFQFYHLLPELSVLENALLPARVGFDGLKWFSQRGRLRMRAIEVLESLELKDRLNHSPKELSGGERQRVAIARALMNRPRILLADEPTGNLDSKTGRQILAVLKKFHQNGQTILMVTHDMALAETCQRVLHMRDGKLG